MKIHGDKHITRKGVIKNNPKKSKENIMISDVSNFLNKICKKMGVECLFKFYKEKDKIFLSTDGFLCTDLSDPYRSEIPYLLKEDFGGEKIHYNSYMYREEFDKILKKYGYGSENYDSCTIVIFKE